MHASIEQLLNLTDAPSQPDVGAHDPGQTESEIRAHVDSCPECQLEAQRIATLRAGLRSLPAVSPASESGDAMWAAITARSGGQHDASHKAGSNAHWWPLGLAASLLLAALMVVLMPSQVTDLPLSASTGSASTGSANGDSAGDASAISASAISDMPLRTVPATSQLVERSQQLEQMLGSLQYQPRVVNARTAGTIAQLEDQIAWIDYGLGEGSDGQLSEDEANALWRQRVELMNSLVHVRYAQAQRVDF